MCLISSLNSRAARYQSADCDTAIGSKLTMVDAYLNEKLQRKHLLTMGPVHPDAQGALNILLSIDEVAKLAFTEIEEALIIKENNLNQIPDVFMEEEDEIAEEYDINEPNF